MSTQCASHRTTVTRAVSSAHRATFKPPNVSAVECAIRTTDPPAHQRANDTTIWCALSTAYCSTLIAALGAADVHSYSTAQLTALRKANVTPVVPANVNAQCAADRRAHVWTINTANESTHRFAFWTAFHAAVFCTNNRAYDSAIDTTLYTTIRGSECAAQFTTLPSAQYAAQYSA